MEGGNPIPLVALCLALARQLGALAVLAAAAAGIGYSCTRRLATSGAVESFAVATATGLGALGSLLFVVGLAGGLYRWVALTFAAAGLALFAGRWVRAHREQRQASPRTTGGTGPRARTAALLLAAAVAPTFLWSLFPPTAFDATTYHLPFARAFVESHRLVVIPELIFTIFPQLGEVLFAGILLATGSDVATHLVQLLAQLLIALLLAAAGRRFFSPWAGVWAAALWLAHPLAHYQAASAYVDTLLALFCLLAVIAWEVWREGQESRGEDGRDRVEGWLALAGAAAGFAAATKYLALLWCGPLVLLALVWGPRRRRLRSVAVLLLVALAVGGPWYARIYDHTGNPIHPLLEPVFTGGAPSRVDSILGLDADLSATDAATAVARGVGAALARPAELAAFAWNASFRPIVFDRQSPLAPWHLVLVPLAALFCLGDRRLLRWLLLVVVYASLWTTHDPRYQLPSIALLALAGAGGLHHLGRRFPRIGARSTRPATAWTLAVILALPGPLYAVYKVVRHGPLPPVTASAREAHLDRELAGYAAVRRLNELHGDRYTVFAVGGSRLAYFARGRLLGHALGPWEVGRVTPLLRDPEALHRELRSMGADHLLVVGPSPYLPLARGPDLARRFRLVLADDRSALFALRDSSYASPRPPVSPPVPTTTRGEPR